jgi:hypothetical protein
MGRADDRADAGEAAVADELLPELAHEPGDVVPQRPTVGEHEILDVRPSFVRGLDHAEHTAAVAPARAEKRLERVSPQVGVDRHRVGERRRSSTRLQVGGGVRARGRADVPALRVGDDDQPRRPRVGADVLERPHAVRAESLEERQLRLHADHVRRHRVHDPAAEAAARLRRGLAREVGVAGELDRQQVGPRIEADQQLRALPLDRLRQAVGEQLGRDCRLGAHSHSGYRALRPGKVRAASAALRKSLKERAARTRRHRRRS